MDLNRANLFVRVVEKGSFTRAAAALGLPKSSVSRGVARLEEDLGVTLLRRTTRSLTLTEAGATYFERARDALHALAEAEQAATEAGDEPRGTVRLTAADLAGVMLAEPLARFARQHPKVRVELILTGRAVDLVGEGVDLAIRGAGRLADSSLIARRVAATPLALYAAPSYLAAAGRPRRVADLARHDCVLYHATGGRARWTLHGRRRAETVEVQGRFTVDEILFAVRLAEEGAGVVLAPLAIVERVARPGRLARVLPDHGVPGGSVYVVHPAMTHLPRRVQLLRDFLIAELQAPTGRG